MNYRIILAVLIMLAFGVSSADEATQIDWSGGQGVPGPVYDWGSSFSTSNMIDFTVIGSLRLTGVFTDPIEHMVDGNFYGSHSVYATDVDGDGDTDVLGAALLGDNITWWENVNGSGASWTEHTVDGNFGGARSVFAADVDGDGDIDVLGASGGSDVSWWENVDGSGTSWTEHTVDDDFYGAESVYATDVDGDGDTDMLGAAQYDNDITWWENVNGSGTSWTEHTIDTDFYGAHSVYAIDVDGDGDTDVLGAACHAYEITWWENVNGSGTSWTEHSIGFNFYGAHSVYATDVDGDGDIDVMGASSWGADWDDDIVWWENVNGSGTSWTKHLIDWDYNSANSVYATDVDGDGDTDVLGAAQFGYDITCWENVDGSGTSWNEHTVDSDFGGAASVYATDVDSDGDIDVLGAGFAFGEITWWEVICYPDGGSLESSILDVQESPDWQTINWNCAEPSGTSVAFQVRASDDPGNMGAWSDTLTASCSLDGIITDGDSLLQYRAILITTDQDLTPLLHDLTIDWIPFTGIQEGQDPEISSFELMGAVPNPSFESVEIVFAVPVDSRIDITVYDLSGRIVITTGNDYEKGQHSIFLENLSSGLYFCLMTSGDFTATQPIVMLD